MKKPIKVSKEVGKTKCDKYCSAWTGSPSVHDCGQPIFEDRYECSECGQVFSSEPGCKTHLSIKH